MIERKLGKIIKVDLSEDEGTEAFYLLTKRMVKALLGQTDYLRWHSRHNTIPDDLSSPAMLERWVSGLELRLMKEYEDPALDCSFIEECILSAIDNPNSPLYDAIRDKLANDKDFLKRVSKGLLPIGTGGLTEGDEDLDELWAECVQIVEYTDAHIRSLQSILEVQSNNWEYAKFVEIVPFLGTLVDEAQIDVAIDFVNYTQEIWKEQYEANWTEDPPPTLGTKYRLACALFCACKNDRIINIDRIVSSFESLIVGGNLSLDSVGEIIQSLIGVNDNNPNIVYVSFTAIWGIARFVSYIGTDRVSSAILASIIKLAKNDANDDWITYCEDCYVCQPAWGSITWYEGTGGSSGDIWTITGEADKHGTPNYVIRNIEYIAGFTKFYTLTSIESTDTVSQIYLEDSLGNIVYNGTDFEAANALLPLCVRFVQVYRPISSGNFTVQFGIYNQV